ncbi:MAG: hypothetical protein KDF58_10865 [Alphaproteobacteria bacterium]|nr:hypothetical protein [Alphaproteobacteria bacterium]HPF46669.1 hypothetical protein [Emcibacteraceae bacterium]HRW28755.1 hypothetical protein [Emcibacteraceae bacterium]
MINEKIDHHFNELSPVDFNIFQGEALLPKLQKQNVNLKKAKALQDHIQVIMEQVETVVEQQDEHLAVVYNFLSEKEQSDYLEFLKNLEKDVSNYIALLTK